MIFYILIFHRNFELIFEFMALKTAPICGRNVCLSFFLFFLSIFVYNSDNFNRRKQKESDPMPKYREMNKNFEKTFRIHNIFLMKISIYKYK